MAGADTLILHHYNPSPFAEKIRLVLGAKGLPWASVIIPNIMPKPDLMPLTGGYRRTPVLQIGADIYCDTGMIARVLEERAPEPCLCPDGLTWMVCRWADGPLFQASVGIVFAGIGEHVPEAFKKDRAEMSGRDFNPAAMAAVLPYWQDQWRGGMHWIDQSLADGRAYLFGARPGLADFSAYLNVWFVRNAYPPGADILDEFARVQDWAGRIAAIGHGTFEPLDAEAALDIARAAEPRAARGTTDPHDPQGLEPGDLVTVTPDDTARIPVEGRLLSSSAERVSIERQDDRVGRVAVHFPRAGFRVAKT